MTASRSGSGADWRYISDHNHGSGRSGFWRNHGPRMLRNGRSLRSYNDLAERNGGGLCREATMPRDNLAGSSSRCPAARDALLALHTDDQKESSDDRPACLENPRPAGAESTLTENVASPFQAEPRHICPPEQMTHRNFLSPRWAGGASPPVPPLPCTGEKMAIPPRLELATLWFGASYQKASNASTELIFRLWRRGWDSNPR